VQNIVKAKYVPDKLARTVHQPKPRSTRISVQLRSSTCPRVTEFLKRETLTPGQSLDSGGLRLSTPHPCFQQSSPDNVFWRFPWCFNTPL